MLGRTLNDDNKQSKCSYLLPLRYQLAHLLTLINRQATYYYLHAENMFKRCYCLACLVALPCEKRCDIKTSVTSLILPVVVFGLISVPAANTCRFHQKKADRPQLLFLVMATSRKSEKIFSLQ